MKRMIKNVLFLGLAASMTTACSYNPFASSNQRTGSLAVGAAAGVGTAAALHTTASPTVAATAGIGAGMLGYYVSTLRYDSAGIIQACGKVYKMGQLVGIYIPTDNLFEVNTAEFLPESKAIIASAANVLHRYPNNSIMISGNTSGFDSDKRELALSTKRAQKVAAALWNAGINTFSRESTDDRKYNYTGFGDYLPVANRITNFGIRTNSRIQITSYPSDVQLQIDKRSQVFNNVGALDDNQGKLHPKRPCGKGNPCFALKDD